MHAGDDFLCGLYKSLLCTPFRSSWISPLSLPLVLLLKRWPSYAQLCHPGLSSAWLWGPWGQVLQLRSICLRYKHADLSNRKYVYNKHDEDSSWQQHFALWLMWPAKLWVTVLNLCPPANRDHSSAFCRNHWSHLVMLSGRWKMLEAVSPFTLWGD